MNELLLRWAQLEPEVLRSTPGMGESAGPLRGREGQVWAAPGEPDDPEGQGLLLHLLWEVIEARGWRWVMLFSPEGEGTPPYLARVTGHLTGEGQTRRGRTPAHALLAGYVALLERQTGKVI